VIAVSSAIPIIDNRREYAKRPSVWGALCWSTTVPRTAAAALTALVPLLAGGLGGTGQSARGAVTPLLAEPMKGPFASLGAACPDCRSTRSIEKPSAPYLEVRILMSGDPTKPPSLSESSTHHLAVRLASGWWLHALGTEHTICGGSSETHFSVSEGDVRIADVLPARGAELLVEMRETAHNYETSRQIDDRRLHVCGVGASGRPSCTELHTYHFPGSAADGWDMTVSFRRDGTMVQAGRSGGTDIKQLYEVKFP